MRRLLLVSSVLLVLFISTQAISVHAQPRAIILSPYENFSPFATAAQIKSTLGSAGFAVDIVNGQNVTVDLLKTVFKNYDFIIYRTGATCCAFVNYSFSFISGEPTNPATINKYASDISAGRVSYRTNQFLEITNNFLQYYYPPGSISANHLVFLYAPLSLRMGTLFKDAGVRTVIGYNGEISFQFGEGDEMAFYLTESLVTGSMVKDSVDLIRQLVTGRFSGTTNQLDSIGFYGDGKFKLSIMSDPTSAVVTTVTLTSTSASSSSASSQVSQLHVTIQARTTDLNGNVKTSFQRGQGFLIETSVVNDGSSSITNAKVLITVYDSVGVPVFLFSTVTLAPGQTQTFSQGYSLGSDSAVGNYQVQIVVLTDYLSNGGTLIQGGSATLAFQVS